MEGILVFNSGSSSLKFSFFDKEVKDLIFEGKCDFEKKHFQVKGSNIFFEDVLVTSLHVDAAKKAFEFLEKKLCKVISIGYRVVHGASKYFKPIILTQEILEDLKTFIPLAPLHLPEEIQIISSLFAFTPNLVHVLCFDTAFFQNLPLYAQKLAIPDSNIRRYGFHGISYEYILSKIESSNRLIVAHLGSGSSLAAIKNSKPLNTTMGFSPAGGVVMETRPGDLDPGLFLYLLKEKKMNPDALEDLIYHQSGLKALSGSTNIEELCKNKDFGIEMYARSIAKAIASLMVDLEGVDDLVFTGGIGENISSIRERIIELLGYLGFAIDKKIKIGLISSAQSSIRIHVIKTDENRIIAEHTKKAIEEKVFL